MCGVSVQDFAIEAGVRNAKTITFTDDGRGVDDGDNEVFRILATTDESKNAVVGVVGVNPFETVPVKIDLMKSGFGGVEMIEVGDEMLDAAMGIPLEQMPFEAAGFAPFVALGEFLAHKEEFLARVGVLIGVKETEIGELLPEVAGHFVKERVFAVDDFVVREGKQEIFCEGVEKRKSELVVLVFAMDRVVRKKAQSVVHPAHVPFEAEAEAAEIGGARNGGPGRGLFGDSENPGESAVSDFVHALEEIDGVEVFAASELIRDPLAGLARVVEIKHGGAGVHAETVNVVLVEPKEGVRNQIVLDFVAAVIVNEGAPVGMRALSRVGVFVEMRAIELGEAVSVAREMRGSPIENDADAGLVAAVNEFHELG